MRIIGIREKGFWGWKKSGPYGILVEEKLDESFIKISDQEPKNARRK